MATLSQVQQEIAAALGIDPVNVVGGTLAERLNNVNTAIGNLNASAERGRLVKRVIM